MRKIIPSLIMLVSLVGCATAENRSSKYDSLRGKRYVVYVADSKNAHTEAAVQIENRIKSALSDRGLLVVDFDQTSLANILKNDGSIAEGQAKRIASNADLIVTGRFSEDHLVDEAINKAGNYRSRLRASFAITETGTSIEKGRFEEEAQELANSYDSAAVHSGIVLGKKAGDRIVEKLLYVYE